MGLARVWILRVPVWSAFNGWVPRETKFRSSGLDRLDIIMLTPD